MILENAEHPYLMYCVQLTRLPSPSDGGMGREGSTNRRQGVVLREDVRERGGGVREEEQRREKEIGRRDEQRDRE